MFQNTQQIAFVITISVLYAFFFNKLAYVFTGRHEIDNMCHYGLYYYNEKTSPEEREERDKCIKERTEMSDSANSKEFVIRMLAGVLGVGLSGAIKNPIVRNGVSLGGLFSILNAIFLYWGHMNEMTKLGVTGSSLVFLIYASVRFINGKNLTQLLTVM